MKNVRVNTLLGNEFEVKLINFIARYGNYMRKSPYVTIHGAYSRYIEMTDPTYVNNCTGNSQVILVTLFLVALYNACFMFQEDKENNLLVSALDTFDLGADVGQEKFITTFSESKFPNNSIQENFAIQHLLNDRYFCFFRPLDALSWYTFDAAKVISNSSVGQKGGGVSNDKGGNHGLYEHIIHSWVGYELVKVLLKYGLSPDVRSDLNDWSEDLYQLFAYFGEKQRDPTNKPTTQMTILFDKTDHCAYFEKLGFGKKTRFEKMSNTILPLVILTWLRQLQEHVYKLPDHSSQTDWCDMGRYFTQPPNKAVSKGVNHVHLSKARSPAVQKMKSFEDVIPKKTGKGTEKVIRSLLKWADMILFRENEYVKDIVTHSFKEGETSIRNKYAMKKKENFKLAVQGETTTQEDEIGEITLATHK